MFFICEWLSTGGSFWVEDGACVLFSSRHWNPIWYRAVWDLCICHSFCGFMRLLALLCVEGLVSSRPPPSALSVALSCFLPSTGFPEPQGEGFDRDSPFRTKCSKASLSTLWLGSPHVFPSTERGIFSDDGQARHQSLILEECHYESFYGFF